MPFLVCPLLFENQAVVERSGILSYGAGVRKWNLAIPESNSGKKSEPQVEEVAWVAPLPKTNAVSLLGTGCLIQSHAVSVTVSEADHGCQSAPLRAGWRLSNSQAVLTVGRT
jgi:hypothetical protein